MLQYALSFIGGRPQSYVTLPPVGASAVSNQPISNQPISNLATWPPPTNQLRAVMAKASLTKVASTPVQLPCVQLAREFTLVGRAAAGRIS